MPSSKNPQQKPLPLWVGLYGGVIEVILFLGIYGSAGDTTRRGWFATSAIATELWGVLLIASPELRPIVERTATLVARSIRQSASRVWLAIRRLLRISTHHYVNLASEITATGSISAKVTRASDPPAGADRDQLVDWLVQEHKRILGLIDTIDNQMREQLGEVRGEITATATALREHTAAAVQEAAKAELHMRLLGVLFVVAGLVLSYAANIA
jgi:hypothetical protein